MMLMVLAVSMTCLCCGVDGVYGVIYRLLVASVMAAVG